MSCWLETLSWDEAEPMLQANPRLLLPLGARLKSHGLHLPLNNDWRIAEHLAKAVSERVDVVVLPTVQFSYFPALVEYPGVHIELETAAELVADICRSLARHGAKRCFVLNTGVSTDKPLELAQQRLAEVGVTLRFNRWREIMAPLEAEMAEQEGGSHADEMETSMMLHLAPEVVRMDRAQPDFHPRLGPGPLTRNPQATRGVYSPTGAWGDPTRATAEKGRRIVAAFIASLVHDLAAL